MGKHKNNPVAIVKTIWWRQTCLTLFFMVVTLFFSFVGKFGPLVSWVGTILMATVSLLCLFDQVFEWSRLKIDCNGFWLRGWFKNLRIAHHEIKDFKIAQFAGKPLLTVELLESAYESRKIAHQAIPFPCCFGRPVDEVCKLVRSKIDRTPKPRISK